MDKFDLLYDSAFNLFKAAEENQKRVDDSLKVLEARSLDLSRTINSINVQFKNELKSTSEIASQKIIDSVSFGLEDARTNAIEAARVYKNNARFSVFKLSLTFFIFFLIAGGILWYFFIKDIPTIEELYQIRAEQKVLTERYEKLRKYGDIKIYGENEDPYIKVKPSGCHPVEDGYYCEIIPK
ncbi:SIMPL domain-containing protein [Vibrio cholerae]|jgi:hypothetical protein|uniref:SIMPL domain-containing protein n=1 Tax=Vibrio cholerae TaxID=666 RepID=UPI0011DB1E09|nr:SIMPL domain-containing protein [Vibrio cholerae]MCR9707134.1 hypothetical protein [Vibrio cholerae]TXZ95526.1 SIMPL domain-containing protein [Vibrio cholerae]GHX72444.1 hypothetical protein VCSRO16_3449 [Vibrio cholerae]